jgi:Tol biopolymer transport system component
LAVVKVTHEPTTYELATVAPSGRSYRSVYPEVSHSGSELDVYNGATWTPDGATLGVSMRTARGSAIYLVPPTGGQARMIPGTRGGFLPVFSPDGRSLAFARVRRRRIVGRYDTTMASVWIVDLETGVRRQLTRWHEELWQYPSSFSPDGTTLLLTRTDYRRTADPEVVALRFDGRTSSLLIGEGAFPVYSPDGSEIALFRRVERRHKVGRTAKGWTEWQVEENSELYAINADGSHLQRLTHTPKKDEFFASWDPSGERIAYSQSQHGELDEEARIMEINADGSCPTKILSRPGVAFIGPAWQPGMDRGAGRILC